MDRCVINFYDTRKDKLSDKWKCRKFPGRDREASN